MTWSSNFINIRASGDTKNSQKIAYLNLKKRKNLILFGTYILVLKRILIWRQNWNQLQFSINPEISERNLAGSQLKLDFISAKMLCSRLFWERCIHSFGEISIVKLYIWNINKRRGIQSFEEWLKLYIKNKLNEKPNDRLVLVLGSIACSSDMKDFISRKPHQESKASLKRISNQLSIVELIYNTLYKFSFSKFKSQAKRPEMLTIMTYFVSRLENSFSEDEKIGVQILINQCRSALN